MLALQENVVKYEKKFGTISSASEPPKFPMNFGGSMGDA